MRRPIVCLRGLVVTMDSEGRVLRDGGVVIVDGVIEAVAPFNEVVREFKPDEVLGGPNDLVIPGLINTHSHAPMTLFKGLFSGYSSMEFLRRVWELESRLDYSVVRAASALAAVEMVRSGITMFADHYFLEDAVIEAAKSVGLRVAPALTLMDEVEGPPKHTLSEAEELIRKYSGDPMVKPYLGPHSLYTCSKSLLKDVSDLSKELRVPIHMHFAESREELRIVKGRYGLSPARAADSLGLLMKGAILAHSCYLSPEEAGLIGSRGAGVAYIPFVKLRGGHEVLPYKELVESGAPVGLGTDGSPSSGTLDILEECKYMLAAISHRYGGASAISTYEAFRAATIDGARCLGLSDKLGSLERGKWGDAVVLSVDRVNATPAENPYYILTYMNKALKVKHVVVNGEVVVRNGSCVKIDEEEVLKEFLKEYSRLRSKD